MFLLFLMQIHVLWGRLVAFTKASWRVGRLAGFLQTDAVSCGPFCWLTQFCHGVGVSVTELAARTSDRSAGDVKIHVLSWIAKHKDSGVFNPQPILEAEACPNTSPWLADAVIHSLVRVRNRAATTTDRTSVVDEFPTALVPDIDKVADLWRQTRSLTVAEQPTARFLAVRGTKLDIVIDTTDRSLGLLPDHQLILGAAWQVSHLRSRPDRDCAAGYVGFVFPGTTVQFDDEWVIVVIVRPPRQNKSKVFDQVAVLAPAHALHEDTEVQDSAEAIEQFAREWVVVHLNDIFEYGVVSTSVSARLQCQAFERATAGFDHPRAAKILSSLELQDVLGLIPTKGFTRQHQQRSEGVGRKHLKSQTKDNQVATRPKKQTKAVSSHAKRTKAHTKRPQPTKRTRALATTALSSHTKRTKAYTKRPQPTKRTRKAPAKRTRTPAKRHTMRRDLPRKQHKTENKKLARKVTSQRTPKLGLDSTHIRAQTRTRSGRVTRQPQVYDAFHVVRQLPEPKSKSGPAPAARRDVLEVCACCRSC